MMDASQDLADTSNNTAGKSLEAVRREQTKAPHTIGFIIFVLVLTTAFGKQLIALVTNALQDGLNSYIILIPFVSAYLLHVDRERLARSYERALGLAALPFLIAMAGLIFLAKIGSAGSLSTNDRNALVTLSFVCLLWSGGFLFMGRKWMATAAFPMFFLVFLVPLPDRIVDWMETGLRLASAEAANLFFTITGTAAMQTGTIFQLPGITIEVAQECSGIRSSWVLFITSLVAAHLFLARPWSRLLLIAAVVPLGILRNGFRIMVIGLLCVHVDPDLIHSVIHRRGGPIFFALSLIPLVLILWFLRRREMASGGAAVIVEREA